MEDFTNFYNFVRLKRPNSLRLSSADRAQEVPTGQEYETRNHEDIDVTSFHIKASNQIHSSIALSSDGNDIFLF